MNSAFHFFFFLFFATGCPIAYVLNIWFDYVLCYLFWSGWQYL